jgi:predicted transposase YbfD/YdcC
MLNSPHPIKTKPNLMTFFSKIDDPRVPGRTTHSLDNIFFMTICAVICGADSGSSIAAFCKAKGSGFGQYLDLPDGTPSHDTFGVLFARIDPEVFQQCFSDWVQSIVSLAVGEVIAIDGQCLRRSYDKSDGKSAIHMVSAWAQGDRLVLGQVKVNEKSNEITALPKLLDRIDIAGGIVTADAMHTQIKSASLIVNKGADYVLALKGNQSTLHDDVALFFEQMPEGYKKSVYYNESIDSGQGRIAIREAWVCHDIDWLTKEHDFPHLASIIKISAKRFVDGRWSEEVRYYISSIKSDDAAKMERVIRDHWSVETGSHWVLDVAFNEDDCRVRMGHAAENLSTFRRIALNLLKSDKSQKVGIKIKRQIAGWDEKYLLQLLSHI